MPRSITLATACTGAACIYGIEWLAGRAVGASRRAGGFFALPYGLPHGPGLQEK
jgi:hypothetical protein